MELTAGLGSVDDYIRYIEAGADECFCGYIPYAWDRKVRDGSVLKPQGGAMLQRAAGCIFGAGNSGGDGAGVSKARAADV